MSEADSPNDQPDSASIDSSEPFPTIHATAAEAVESSNEEGWETVDFPGAISIDALPHSQATPPTQLATTFSAIEQGVIHYSSAELDPATAHLTLRPSEDPDALTQLQHLQKENATLRDRLAQAELDLVQHQIEWQLEAACSPAETTTVAMKPTAALQPSPVELTHDRLHQLLQELERSQQAAQRQQILVETLTDQLESSQERIAQLERDCALTQQRHNEQVQQVLQAESACRDLRLRLHRQQQQTLQFKAALEKCLEMPTVYSQTSAEVALDDGTTPHPLSALLKPKNQPVKPWSQPVDEAQGGTNDSVLPPVFKLLKHGGSEQSSADLWQADDALMAASPFGGENQGQTIDVSTDSSTLLDSDDPRFVSHLMQLMFPDTAAGQAYPGTEALEADVSQAAALSDLSPFPGAERPPSTLPSSMDNHQASALPERLPDEQIMLDIGATAQAPFEAVLSETAAIAPTTLPEDPSADLLWHNLAALIDPAPIAPSTDATPAVEDASTPVASTQAPSSRGGIPPLSAAPYPALPPTVAPVSASALVSASSNQSVQPINTWTWRDRLSSRSKAPLVPMAEETGTEETGIEKTGTEETGTEETGTEETGIEVGIEQTEASSIVAEMAQHPAKLLSLSTLNRQPTVKQTVNVSSQTKPASASFATATPPIVYPLRSSKKLASLAAVDLPTFPKR